MPGKDNSIGGLRTRVAIYRLKETGRDEYGAVALVPEADPADWRWADVDELVGREYWWAQQAQATTSHTVRLYFYPGLSPLTHRLRLEDGTWLNIESAVNPDGVRIWHVCKCTAQADPAKARTQQEKGPPPAPPAP